MTEKQNSNLSIENKSIKRKASTILEAPDFTVEDFTNTIFVVNEFSSELAIELFNSLNLDDDRYTQIVCYHRVIELVTRKNDFSIYSQYQQELERLVKLTKETDLIDDVENRIGAQFMYTILHISYLHNTSPEILEEISKYIDNPSQGEGQKSYELMLHCLNFSRSLLYKEEEKCKEYMQELEQMFEHKFFYSARGHGVKTGLLYHTQYDMGNAEKFLLEQIKIRFQSRVPSLEKRRNIRQNTRGEDQEILVGILDLLHKKEKGGSPYLQKETESLYREIKTLFLSEEEALPEDDGNEIEVIPSYKDAQNIFLSLIRKKGFGQGSIRADFAFEKVRYIHKYRQEEGEYTEKEALHNMTMAVYRIFQDPIEENREAFIRTTFGKQRMEAYVCDYKHKDETVFVNYLNNLDTTLQENIVQTLNKRELPSGLSEFKDIIDAFETGPEARKKMVHEKVNALSVKANKLYEQSPQAIITDEEQEENNDNIAAIIREIEEIYGVSKFRTGGILEDQTIAIDYSDHTLNTILNQIAIFSNHNFMPDQFKKNARYSLNDFESPIYRSYKKSTIIEYSEEAKLKHINKSQQTTEDTETVEDKNKPTLKDYPLDTNFMLVDSSDILRRGTNIIWFDTVENKSLFSMNHMALEEIICIILRLLQKNKVYEDKKEWGNLLDEVYHISDDDDMNDLKEGLKTLSPFAFGPGIMALRQTLMNRTPAGIRSVKVYEFLQSVFYGLSVEEKLTLLHIAHVEDIFEEHKHDSQNVLQEAVTQYFRNNNIINHQEFYHTMKILAAMSNQFTNDRNNDQGTQYHVKSPRGSSLFESPPERKSNVLSEAYNCFNIYTALSTDGIQPEARKKMLNKLESLGAIINFTSHSPDSSYDREGSCSSLPVNYFDSPLPEISNDYYGSSMKESIEEVRDVHYNKEFAELLRVQQAISILNGGSPTVKRDMQDIFGTLQKTSKSVGSTQFTVVRRHTMTDADGAEVEMLRRYKDLLLMIHEKVGLEQKYDVLLNKENPNVNEFKKNFTKILKEIPKTEHSNYFESENEAIQKLKIETTGNQKLIPSEIKKDSQLISKMKNMNIHSVVYGEGERDEQSAKNDAEILGVAVSLDKQWNNTGRDIRRIQVVGDNDVEAGIEDRAMAFAYDRQGSETNVMKLWGQKKYFPDETNIAIGISHSSPISAYLAISRKQPHKKYIHCGELFTNRYKGGVLRQDLMIPLEEQDKFITVVNNVLDKYVPVSDFYNLKKHLFSKAERARFSIIERLPDNEFDDAMTDIFTALGDAFGTESLEYTNAKNIFAKYVKGEDDG